MSAFSALDFRRDTWRPGPLLPPGRGRDSVLIFVVAILTFLACLAGVGSLGANRAANGWQAQLVGSASVIIRPSGAEGADAAAIKAAEVLSGVAGVEQAKLLERREAEDLLRPWLGGQALADLPIPQLIAVDLKAKSPATAASLRQALAAAGVDGEVDDHSMWSKQIVGAGVLARVAALGAAVLLALAAGAVINFATRASIRAHEEAIHLLHYSGAEDRLVADILAQRFAWLSLQAAAIGAVLAAGLAGTLRVMGGTQGLVPFLPVHWVDLAVVVVAPIAAGGVGALAARAAALRLLSRIP